MLRSCFGVWLGVVFFSLSAWVIRDTQNQTLPTRPFLSVLCARLISTLLRLSRGEPAFASRCISKDWLRDGGSQSHGYTDPPMCTIRIENEWIKTRDGTTTRGRWESLKKTCVFWIVVDFFSLHKLGLRVGSKVTVMEWKWTGFHIPLAKSWGLWQNESEGWVHTYQYLKHQIKYRTISLSQLGSFPSCEGDYCSRQLIL